MFSYNRLSVRTLSTMENHAVINIIFCVATWNRAVKVDRNCSNVEESRQGPLLISCVGA